MDSPIRRSRCFESRLLGYPWSAILQLLLHLRIRLQIFFKFTFDNQFSFLIKCQEREFPGHHIWSAQYTGGSGNMGMQAWKWLFPVSTADPSWNICTALQQTCTDLTRGTGWTDPSGKFNTCSSAVWKLPSDSHRGWWSWIWRSSRYDVQGSHGIPAGTNWSIMKRGRYRAVSFYADKKLRIWSLIIYGALS